MRFLLDQDVYAVTARYLERQGHDVRTASALGLAQATDAQLLTQAREQGRILVTRDRDFGGLTFLGEAKWGVLYLRVTPSTVNAVHTELDQVLRLYGEEQLRKAFVVVERGATPIPASHALMGSRKKESTAFNHSTRAHEKIHQHLVVLREMVV